MKGPHATGDLRQKHTQTEQNGKMKNTLIGLSLALALVSTNKNVRHKRSIEINDLGLRKCAWLTKKFATKAFDRSREAIIAKKRLPQSGGSCC